MLETSDSYLKTPLIQNVPASYAWTTCNILKYMRSNLLMGATFAFDMAAITFLNYQLVSLGERGNKVAAMTAAPIGLMFDTIAGFTYAPPYLVNGQASPEQGHIIKSSWWWLTTLGTLLTLLVYGLGGVYYLTKDQGISRAIMRFLLALAPATFFELHMVHDRMLIEHVERRSDVSFYIGNIFNIGSPILAYLFSDPLGLEEMGVGLGVFVAASLSATSARVYIRSSENYSEYALGTHTEEKLTYFKQFFQEGWRSASQGCFEWLSLVMITSILSGKHEDELKASLATLELISFVAIVALGVSLPGYGRLKADKNVVHAYTTILAGLIFSIGIMSLSYACRETIADLFVAEDRLIPQAMHLLKVAIPSVIADMTLVICGRLLGAFDQLLTPAVISFGWRGLGVGLGYWWGISASDCSVAEGVFVGRMIGSFFAAGCLLAWLSRKINSSQASYVVNEYSTSRFFAIGENNVSRNGAELVLGIENT